MNDTEMTHEQQIKSDVDLYGVAYEQIQPDGTVKRLDPRNIRVINPKRPECPPSCNYTGECWASFTADEPCRSNPPSPDWIRSRTPPHLRKGNM